MRIDDEGNVGINQATPTAKLHVNGNTIITGNLTVSGTSTTVSTTNTFVTDDILTLIVERPPTVSQAGRLV